MGVVTHQDDIYAIDWDYKAVDSVMNIDDKVQLAKKYSKTISQDRQLLIEARIVRFLKRQKESTF